MKRYSIYLEHFNDNSEVVFKSDKLEESLRFIADNIDNSLIVITCMMD